MLSVAVSVPYEITLLSNLLRFSISFPKVSVPYEITLLSNEAARAISTGTVSVPYEITLLSNLKPMVLPMLVFQYLMKLHYSQTFVGSVLQNLLVSVPYEITLLSNRSFRY